MGLLERAWQRTVQGGLSVRATEKVIGELLFPPNVSAKSGSSASPLRPDTQASGKNSTAFFSDPQEASLTEELRQRVGTKVYVRRDAKGMGRVEIEFYDEEDLERIFEVLLGGGRR